MFLKDIGTASDLKTHQPFIPSPPSVPQKNNWIGVAIVAAIAWPFAVAAVVCMLPVMAVSWVVDSVFHRHPISPAPGR